MTNCSFLSNLQVRTFFRLYIAPFAWCTGFFFGAVAASYAEPPVFSMMLRALQTPMSIDGLLAVYFLPLLIGTMLTQAKHKTLLCLLCFVKAFGCAYLMRCISFCTPGGCFFVPLLLASSFYSGILLLWLSVRALNKETPMPFLPPILITLVAACLEFFVLSPFMVTVST